MCLYLCCATELKCAGHHPDNDATLSLTKVSWKSACACCMLTQACKGSCFVSGMNSKVLVCRPGLLCLIASQSAGHLISQHRQKHAKATCFWQAHQAPFTFQTQPPTRCVPIYKYQYWGLRFATKTGSYRTPPITRLARNCLHCSLSSIRDEHRLVFKCPTYQPPRNNPSQPPVPFCATPLENGQS